MSEGQPSSAALAPVPDPVTRWPVLLDIRDNALRPIGKAELVDFQRLAQLAITDE